MIIIKSQAEIKKIAAACRITAEIIEKLKTFVGAGVSTADMESFADSEIRRKNALPAFKGYRGYPASVCVSINDQVVHGIPSRTVKLRNGDIVSIDLGVVLDGFYGDAAVTLPVGDISDEASRLIKTTENAFYAGMEKAVIGNRVSDISYAIQEHVESKGFSVVRAFVGHGIGRSLHEEPQVPNFGKPGHGPRLKTGMTMAVEPMVNAGGPDVRILDDGWTAVTADGSLSAHYEHTVVITGNGAEILTKI
ncbi:MAG: type I methionyl aminopeptidase [Nitrospirae bacterium GWC2_46_6]|nr:MAG: type I methionyl aminopeptidase [Nitrospirae bacterium GWC2_46_6]OGW20659.1 MAG: type I methionyl aminopeptidase [Nitrospirae bacterium GWA2_46_11]OGW24654.1 MAG: type I methionyl aminopeptidase [Nitrospirae bacterium GWB2_47_37]HAK88087.1 type I methionyl aminopeptidase [Nitrospiraceae bacterium]HCL80768.1 type I methionyl aminopeptidase [Nitrospiraceae bacterium]